MATVEIVNVRKSYAELEVIHGVDIRIEDGEFVVLVGPSGCGKSTLLQMIAGLEPITDGEIHINGKVVNNLPPKDRDIAMVFQNYALYPHMTVAQNMGFSLKIRRIAADQINQRVNAAADILGLQNLLERFPRELSGGQRQRVAMGRAIVREPQVFLFDEPLSNLDAKLRGAMRTEIKDLHQRLKTTTVFVTHDQIEAMSMADKIVVMSDGRVEQIGAPLELYDNPCNEFVAGFIGSPSMNFFKGTISDGKFQTASGLSWDMPTHVSNVETNQEYHYGIRPEHCRIGQVGVPAKVLVIEPSGSETQIVCEIDSQKHVCLFHERIQLSVGETVHIEFESQNAHLFDAQSGSRL